MKTIQHRTLSGCNPYKSVHPLKKDRFVSITNDVISLKFISSVLTHNPQGLVVDLPVLGIKLDSNLTRHTDTFPISSEPFNFGME